MRHGKLIMFLLLGVAFPKVIFADKCLLGSQLKELARLEQGSVHRERVLREVIQNPVFQRDDERMMKAQLELMDYPKSRKSVKNEIVEFVNKPKKLPNENLLRERRANALFQILEDKNREAFAGLEKKIHEILLVELPETAAAKRLNSDQLSDVTWVKRLKTLSDRNQNQLVLDEYGKRLQSLKKEKLDTCDVRYLIGRAYRKNRNYQEAIERLDEVAKNCSMAEGRDAAFLLTRLAAIVPRSENMVFFDRFEKKYIGHSYYDDVLIFKSSALDSLGRKDEARAMLRKITNLTGESDMRFEAFFRLAFSFALEGKSDEAVKILKNSLSHPGSSQMSLMERHRAMYWSARLEIFNDIGKVEKRKTLDQFPNAVGVLNSLVDSTNPTIYSWLSSGITQRELKKRTVRNSRQESENTLSSPLFDSIYCLVLDGQKGEATRFLENISPYEIDAKSRIGIAKRLDELGMYAESFRFAASSPNPSDGFNNLLFPKPYEKTVAMSVEKIGIPKNLLFSLMREESRFDTRVVSWAGAHGLLQLMPQVAKSEGKKLGMKDVSEEEMFDPQINILLAAEHLKGMKDELKHPFLMIAAYNAGLSRVKKWKEDFGAHTALDTFIENIPLPETRNYVKRVAGSWINYSEIYADIDPFLANVDSSSRL